MSKPTTTAFIPTFRCSSLGDLMSDGRGGSKAELIAKRRAEVEAQQVKVDADNAEKKEHLKTSKARAAKLEQIKNDLQQLIDTPETPEEKLGETAKSKCRAIVLEQIYGALEEHESDATRHGNLFEPAAILQYGEMIGANKPKKHSQFRKNMVRKNIEHGKGDASFILTGEPDVIFKDIIFEFKCPFSISSFETQCRTPIADYILQVQGYMLLFGLDKAEIITSLFRNKNIKSDKVFENTPRYKRFHTFTVHRDDAVITAILERLELCAQYVRQFSESFNKNAGFYKYKEYRQMLIDF
jgi:hypothetical protein